MKALIFNFNGKLEAQLENGSSIQGEESETPSKFRKRVASYITEVELEDPEMEKNITFTTVKKMSAEELETAIKAGATGLYLEMLNAALEILNKNAEAETAKEAAAQAKQAEADAKAALRAEKEAEREAIKAAKEAAKAEKAAAREAAKAAREAAKIKRAEEVAARKAAREEARAAKEAEKAARKKAREEAKANRPTVEQVLAEAEELKSMKNSVVTFVPFGKIGEDETPETVTGVINGVVTDKRVPMNLFRIYVTLEDDTRKTFHLRPTNLTLVVDQEATAKLQAEIVAAEEAKQAEKQAKADAIAAKKTAREEAKAAKEAEKAEKTAAREAAKAEKAEKAAAKEAAKAAAKTPETVYEFDADIEEDETADLF